MCIGSRALVYWFTSLFPNIFQCIGSITDLMPTPSLMSSKQTHPFQILPDPSFATL